MHTRIVLLALFTLFAAGCESVVCGEGTTERDGACVASSETVDPAKCGPFTVLQGDRCVPMLPPTVCDPGSTEPDVDEMGVTTCIGTGAGGCSARLACPMPSPGGHQTICGQIYNFETGQPFADAGATGAQCTAATASGPCSLGIRAFEATTFVMTGGTSGVLTTGEVYIDDCGRYRVSNITVPGTPLIALGVDDAVGNAGPMGTTNSVGAGTATASGEVTRDLELFVVPGATLAGWTPNTANGPPFGATQGIYAPIFRGHSTGTDTVAGVTVTRNGAPIDTRDYYFTDTPNRTTLSAGATATSSNGGALFSIDPPSQMLTDAYSGTGGLPAGCIWAQHPGASVGFVILVQVFRPINAPGMTCPL
jgi:hypothetical protein